mgnify:CR=1 FL=1
MQKYQKISTQQEGMAHSGGAKNKKANFDTNNYGKILLQSRQNLASSNFNDTAALTPLTSPLSPWWLNTLHHGQGDFKIKALILAQKSEQIYCVVKPLVQAQSVLPLCGLCRRTADDRVHVLVAVFVTQIQCLR